MIHIRRQSSSKRRLSISFAFLLVCLAALPAFALSSLSGSLTDPTGGVVSDATIRPLRPADRSTRETLTDSQGQFFFAHLDPGEYRLTAAFPGFPTVTRTITLADAQAGPERIQFVGVARQSESEAMTAEVNEMDALALTPPNGSNSCRCHAWKAEVQVSAGQLPRPGRNRGHYPTGASKWNP